MKTLASTLILLALALPATFAEPGWMSTGASLASKGVQMAHSANKAVLGKSASLTSGIPLVGNAMHSTNQFYNDATTVKGAIRIISRSIATAVNLVGRSNIVALIKMFRDALLSAMQFAKDILLQRLSSVPIVGAHFKQADDVLYAMMNLARAAGVPIMPVEALYAFFLVIVKGLFSAIGIN